MALDFATSYAAIIKSERQEDGTLLVYGKATDDSLDIDQQICDAAWLDRAMPEWFKSGGNIREQHSHIAAGVAKEYEGKSDGHYITALVVDPISVKKVENNVLKGFSIGIKSPRVVRDQKAANGRIVDGQIVEVSLVDRPANPNAKLMLAKSIDGESSLVKVEELVNMKSATELIAEAKSFVPTIVKFDKTAYEAARNALASLIATEAAEMTEGHDEQYSLAMLLSAVNALFAWYEGEEHEGEVAEIAETIEMAADSEDKPADEVKAEDAVCSDCGESEKMCKCDKSASAEETDMDKSAEHKCLECGCGKPADSHGDANVTTAEMVEEKTTTAEEVELPIDDVPAIDLEVTPDKTADTSDELDSDTVKSIIAKAIQSAKDAVREELNILKSAKEAVEQEVTLLQADLAKANSMAVGSGPKRTTIKSADVTPNINAIKAAEYLSKAANTTDKDLAEGYKELAKKFSAKS